jgi:hypothetical protein
MSCTINVTLKLDYVHLKTVVVALEGVRDADALSRGWSCAAILRQPTLRRRQDAQLLKGEEALGAPPNTPPAPASTSSAAPPLVVQKD